LTIHNLFVGLRPEAPKTSSSVPHDDWYPPAGASADRTPRLGMIELVLTVTGADVVYSVPPLATFTPEGLPLMSPA
jgi:hypothetical protein